LRILRGWRGGEGREDVCVCDGGEHTGDREDVKRGTISNQLKKEERVLWMKGHAQKVKGEARKRR